MAGCKHINYSAEVVQSVGLAELNGLQHRNSCNLHDWLVYRVLRCESTCTDTLQCFYFSSSQAEL